VTDSIEKSRAYPRMPALRKLKVQACLYFKPGSHKIDVARLKIGSDANVCVHLKGDRDGFVIENPSILMTMMGINISAPRGFLDLITGHKVHRRWDTIKVIDGVPYLNEWHTDTDGPLYGWDHRSTNIFKNMARAYLHVTILVTSVAIRRLSTMRYSTTFPLGSGCCHTAGSKESAASQFLEVHT